MQGSPEPPVDTASPYDVTNDPDNQAPAGPMLDNAAPWLRWPRPTGEWSTRMVTGRNWRNAKWTRASVSPPGSRPLL